MSCRTSISILLIWAACTVMGCSAEEGCSREGPCATWMAPPSKVRSWGTMREVMRDGLIAGRVGVREVARPGTYGLGALEGLRGEVTIDNGVAHVSVVENGAARERLAEPGDRAALLVVGHVRKWSAHALPAIGSLTELEDFIARTARAAGLAPSTEPFLLRVEGSFQELSMHVVNGSCPRAHPEGPAPWRLSAGSGQGVLVGIYAEGREGTLTHHGRRIHVHALLRTLEGRPLSGHVDGLSMTAGGRLQLPQAPPR